MCSDWKPFLALSATSFVVLTTSCAADGRMASSLQRFERVGDNAVRKQTDEGVIMCELHTTSMPTAEELMPGYSLSWSQNSDCWVDANINGQREGDEEGVGEEGLRFMELSMLSCAGVTVFNLETGAADGPCYESIRVSVADGIAVIDEFPAPILYEADTSGGGAELVPKWFAEDGTELRQGEVAPEFTQEVPMAGNQAVIALSRLLPRSLQCGIRPTVRDTSAASIDTCGACIAERLIDWCELAACPNQLLRFAADTSSIEFEVFLGLLERLATLQSGWVAGNAFGGTMSLGLCGLNGECPSDHRCSDRNVCVPTDSWVNDESQLVDWNTMTIACERRSSGELRFPTSLPIGVQSYCETEEGFGACGVDACMSPTEGNGFELVFDCERVSDGDEVTIRRAARGKGPRA